MALDQWFLKLWFRVPPAASRNLFESKFCVLSPDLLNQKLWNGVGSQPQNFSFTALGYSLDVRIFQGSPGGSTGAPEVDNCWSREPAETAAPSLLLGGEVGSGRRV